MNCVLQNKRFLNLEFGGLVDRNWFLKILSRDL